MATLIIAEAGVNHNGDLDLARKLVAAAAEAGADIVKFQSFVTAKIISREAPKAAYQKGFTDPGESQFDMLRKLELSRDDHLALVAECRRHGIEFLSTAFDEESVDLLDELGVARVKIPSGEITNLPLVRYMTRQGKPVILSTGMASLGDIEAILDVIVQNGTPRDRVTILHCTTEYPTPFEDVNLRAMGAIGAAFGAAVGLSDHSVGIEVAIAAVAMGATVIEKHFTLDRNLPGPDHQASLEPHQLKAMVSAIRNVECAMGNGIKRTVPSEAGNKAIARKSIVASRAIARGEILGPHNMTAKRPGTGLSPMRWDEVAGRPASRDFAPDDQIVL